MQIASDKLHSLLPGDGKCLRRECRMEFIVGQQLHAPREVVVEYVELESVPRALVGGDVIEGLLKSEPIQCLRAAGMEAVQQIGEAFVSSGRLQIGVMLHRTQHSYGRTVLSVRKMSRIPLGRSVSEALM
jgi:hypothetical protein